MNQEEFSQGLEQAYKNALAGADAITANAALIRREAEKELEAAKETRSLAEAEGARMAQEYFARARTQLMETAVTERLRRLTEDHLEAGESPEDICMWLEVEPPFVEAIRAAIARDAALRAGPPEPRRPEGNPTLRCQSSGRGGTFWYENGAITFDMWWEFAGGDALVIVDIPKPEQWEARTKLPLNVRMDVLTFIGEAIVARHASGGSFLIGDSVLTIYGP